MKKLFLLTTFCGIAAAQTFNGTHPTGAACGDNEKGNNNCAYVGNITNDPYSAYVYITDTTGIVTGFTLPSRNPPPTVDLFGAWNGTFVVNDGTGHGPTITVSNGVCELKGGPPNTRYFYSVVYTLQCTGLDSNGNPVERLVTLTSNGSTTRAGLFFQQLTDSRGFPSVTVVTPGVVQVAPQPPPPPPPPPTGDDGGSN